MGKIWWKDTELLGLPANLTQEWDSFISLLCENFISIDEGTEDALCWSKNLKGGSFTSKLGYNTWEKERQEALPRWWWNPLWKIKAPLRCKLTLSLALKHKLLMWDNGLKRGWIGPNRHVLCKSDAESVSTFSFHVFMQDMLPQ